MMENPQRTFRGYPFFTGRQSKKQKEICEKFWGRAELLQTGPLILSCGNRSPDSKEMFLLERRLPRDTGLLLFVSGTKTYGGQFFAHETMDEFMDGAKDLLNCVSSLKNIHLLFRFCPRTEKYREEILEFLPQPENVTFVRPGDISLSQTFKIADGCIGYATTCLEEALL